MTPVRIEGREGLFARVGEELGVSAWHELSQEDVNDFARLTGDDDWLHVDIERADRELGGPIVHGLFTLGLGPRCIYELYEVVGFSQEYNYGYQKVRFPSQLPVGSKVRMRATLQSVEEMADEQLKVTMSQVFEFEGGQKPACVAEALLWYTP